MLYEAEAPRSFKADLCLVPFVVPLVDGSKFCLGSTNHSFYGAFTCHLVPYVELYDAAGGEMRCRGLRVAYLRFGEQRLALRTSWGF